MIIYLTISLITLCFCRITYLWVIHKIENKREVTLADELVHDNNGIIVTDLNLPTQTIGRFNHNRDYFIPLRETKKNFLPKKDIKSHTLVERKYIIYRPGAYTREVEVSIVNLNRENE